MSRLVSKSDGPELERFARRFLSKYLAHGFQSLSKRDVELLLFYELELSDLISASASNHDVAKSLRLTGRKVSNLRRDAWARWAEENEIKEHLRASLKQLLSVEALTTVLSENRRAWSGDGLIPLLLEHPSDRAEVEQFLKRRHSIPHYAKNREVILVPHKLLLDLSAGLGGTVQKKQLSIVRSAFIKDADLKAFLTKDLRELSWREARQVLNVTVAEMLHKASVDAAARGLSSVFGGVLE
ncbi:MAG TPA: hypothetical protein PKA88_07650 [Polyangiaceae bacterium]|nr:hypothetical protein [Polyangiaceae bacterium]HMR80285.1 hypothetical protein [Polyangiaceae bacterium]